MPVTSTNSYTPGADLRKLFFQTIHYCLLSSAFCLLPRVPVEVVEQDVRHYFDADDEALFVNVEVGRVPARRDSLRAVADAEEVVEAGDDLLIRGEVFGGHERLER